jgi:hypothetical protein
MAAKRRLILRSRVEYDGFNTLRVLLKRLLTPRKLWIKAANRSPAVAFACLLWCNYAHLISQFNEAP